MCGIFGYIGKKQELKKNIFVTLGVSNDERGGDNCGVLITNKLEYGNPDRLFQDFYPKSELLKNTKQCSLALGHTRKASIGGTSHFLAQPVVLENKQTKEQTFVLLHNGTIRNYKELAQKYNIDIDPTWSDSIVMAMLFKHRGYQVLQEYEGAGVFITVTFKDEKYKDKTIIRLFKGGSKEAIGSTVLTEERPLYVVEEHHPDGYSSWWISSLEGPLNALFYKELIEKPTMIAYPLGANKLYELELTSHGAKLLDTIKYDRSTKVQKVFNTNVTHTAEYYQNQYPQIGTYNNYENAYNNAYNRYTQGTLKCTYPKPAKSSSPIIYSATSADPLALFSTHAVEIQTQLYYEDGLYYIKKYNEHTLAHGPIKINREGILCDANTYLNDKEYLTVFFFNGILLKHEKFYHFLIYLMNFLGYSIDDFVNNVTYYDLVLLASYHPFFDTNDETFCTTELTPLVGTEKKDDGVSENSIEYFLFSGELRVLGSSATVNIKNGQIKSKNFSGGTMGKFVFTLRQEYNDPFEDFEDFVFWDLISTIPQGNEFFDYLTQLDAQIL